VRLLHSYARRSYAQDGEDLLLAQLFAGQGRGFYVDVGAHHPLRFSNTYLLYRRGWRGLNLDPTPGSMLPFRRLRPHDLSLELAVAEQPGTRLLYRFADAAFNTFDPDVAVGHKARGLVALEPVAVQALPLATILERHLPPATPIDLLSVDVEGLDFAVLRSNDWVRFRPRCVLVEWTGELAALADAPAVRLLAPLGYRPVARTLRTLLLRL
jgi:FkbM family methyltransferase